jgi:hypothetical protein
VNRTASDGLGAEAPPDPELLAEAVEELRRLPRSKALEAALRHLEAAPRVGGVLRRREALRRWDEEWGAGLFWTRDEADRAVARRLGVAPSTVRGWRWTRDVFG